MVKPNKKVIDNPVLELDMVDCAILMKAVEELKITGKDAIRVSQTYIKLANFVNASKVKAQEEKTE